MFKKCWKEYVAWLKAQWKEAWGSLRDALITLADAVITWAYTILGSVFWGLWQLVVKPMAEYFKKVITDWLNGI